MSYKPFWYYEYTVKYYDNIDQCSCERSGVLTAKNYTEAVQSLCNFYGENKIENILTLKILFEGPVMEFDEVNQSKDIDFNIYKV